MEADLSSKSNYLAAQEQLIDRREPTRVRREERAESREEGGEGAGRGEQGVRKEGGENQQG